MALIVVACLAVTAFASYALIARLQFHPPQDGRDWGDAPIEAVADDFGWTAIGGGPDATKFSRLDQITERNVGRLQVAWVHSTGETGRRGDLNKRAKFEVTPILAGRNLVFCTPFNRVEALDPATGKLRWSFDAKITRGKPVLPSYNCRGLARWVDPAAVYGQPCAERVFMATGDRRLIALDARTGKRCRGFGDDGEVTVIPVRDLPSQGDIEIAAAPAVIGNTVVVGSSFSPQMGITAPPGRVYAFDAGTGGLKWSFNPVPNGQAGGGNVWSSISGDPARDLVFLPTSSARPNFYGGGRKAREKLTDAIVALRASTGQIVWSFQTVHHDLWDMDVPAAPALFTLRRKGKAIPALAFATKSGFLFVLNRETGAPLYKVEERPVPVSDVPGEQTSPTQPYSALPVLARQAIAAKDAFGLTPFDRAYCRRALARLRNDGLFTPPGLRGTLYFPGTMGGANWGGVAIDPATNRLIVNTIGVAEAVSLKQRSKAGKPSSTGYAEKISPLLSPFGIPCNPPPWGRLTAIDLDTGKLAWQKTLGTTALQAPFGIALAWGTPNVGGPLVTAGHLVFIAAAMDGKLRAFDIRNGRELWAGDLPAGGQASPMTYAIGGRQYVVIAAGGHPDLGTRRGDDIVAFALPR